MTTSEEERLTQITRLVKFVLNSDGIGYEAKELENAREELEWEALYHMSFLLDIVHGGTSWRRL